MVDTLLEFMLGPFRSISEFYFHNQWLFNTVIIGAALYKIFTSKKKEEEKEPVDSLTK